MGWAKHHGLESHRINHKARPFIFQNIGPGRGNGVTALRYINQVLRLHIVPYFGRQDNAQLDNARAHIAMTYPQSAFKSNRALAERNPEKTQ